MGYNINVQVGSIYWDCAYHPVLCTEVNGDEIAGISLYDGSRPRSCSIDHCGVIVLTPDQVEILIRNREVCLEAEKKFRSSEVFDTTPYVDFFSALDASGQFVKES